MQLTPLHDTSVAHANAELTVAVVCDHHAAKPQSTDAVIWDHHAASQHGDRSPRNSSLCVALGGGNENSGRGEPKTEASSRRYSNGRWPTTPRTDERRRPFGR